MVQVAYGTDLDVQVPELTAAAAAVPRVIAEPPPGVMRSDVNLAILRALNRLAVDIPFPQRVVRQA